MATSKTPPGAPTRMAAIVARINTRRPAPRPRGGDENLGVIPRWNTARRCFTPPVGNGRLTALPQIRRPTGSWSHRKDVIPMSSRHHHVAYGLHKRPDGSSGKSGFSVTASRYRSVSESTVPNNVSLERRHTSGTALGPLRTAPTTSEDTTSGCTATASFELPLQLAGMAQVPPPSKRHGGQRCRRRPLPRRQLPTSRPASVRTSGHNRKGPS